jgi:hypothetical protein
VTRDDLAAACRRVLEAAWDPAGYTAPNPTTYPWQWLWDSCFHAIVWTELGDERGMQELQRLLSFRDGDGFVAHVIYAPHDNPHALFWGRSDTSSITQPPMYGHALAELSRRGVDVPESLLDAASLALSFLLDQRARTSTGLIRLCHPWESGADDSPRWDHWYGDDRYRVKGELLRSIERSAGGAPIANPAFDVAPASFNALVAFNLFELASIRGDHGLSTAASALADSLDTQWDARLRTWCDAGAAAETSGRVRTLDSLLPLLVVPRDDAFDALVDPAAHGAPFGPTGVHRAEPSFDPTSYWRGSAWPQVSYLLWVAARRAGRDDVARALAAATVAAAERSGFAEHWNPDSGESLGAVPQSWTTLALLMA